MTDYKVGDWLEDKQNGDLYEILNIDEDWIKIGKKFDNFSKTDYKPIFNKSYYVKHLAEKYIPATMARLLLQYSNNK